MNFHVITEKRNTKMLYTGFPQVAQAITTEKADCSLFSHRGKDQFGGFSGSGLLFSSLTAFADGGGMALENLWLTLSRYSVTSYLLVSA